MGKIDGSVSEHLDLLDEQVVRWSEWFREKIRNGANEQQLRFEFAMLEHSEINAFASTGSLPVTRHSSLIDKYEAADPSYMAVGAAMRYWKKFHPESLTN